MVTPPLQGILKEMIRMEGCKVFKSVTILVADDDEDDCLMIGDAFKESGFCSDLRFVEDGEELMDYLHHRGKHADPSLSPHPGLVLLDLNMPKKDGREALREIKGDPRTRDIPVVILTTSNEHADILRSYETGASSFIVKPMTFERLVAVIKALSNYWFDIVELPLERQVHS